jgi:hypothetical protein
MLRSIFGPKRDEETGKWSKLHNEELNYLTAHPTFCWGDQIEKNKMDGACSTL